MYAFALFSILALFCALFFFWGYSIGVSRQGKKLLIHVDGIQKALHDRIELTDAINAKLLNKIKELEGEKNE
jgi:hypothetical protein